MAGLNANKMQPMVPSAPIYSKKNDTDINKLRELVRYHERKYYIDDQPEISDADFDALT